MLTKYYYPHIILIYQESKGGNSMLSLDVIKKLDSNSISQDEGKVRERLYKLWEEGSKLQKSRAVLIGGYTDTKAFSAARSNGRISVRMAISLALAFDINPFYINGFADFKIKLTVDQINRFLKRYGFSQYTINEANNPPIFDPRIYGNDIENNTILIEDSGEEWVIEKHKSVKEFCEEIATAEEVIKYDFPSITPTEYQQNIEETNNNNKLLTAVEIYRMMLDLIKCKNSNYHIEFEDMLVFLNALRIEEKINKPDAVNKMKLIKKILLSK